MGALADLLPALAVTLPAGTTADGLLRILARDYPTFGAVAFQEGKFSGAFQVVLDDQLLDLAGGWERALVDGDVVMFLPPFAGG
ncbi:MAG TPA: MoaD/ThiS family protein [Symbiobacteriaceae bacterium]